MNRRAIPVHAIGNDKHVSVLTSAQQDYVIAWVISGHCPIRQLITTPGRSCWRRICPVTVEYWRVCSDSLINHRCWQALHQRRVEDRQLCWPWASVQKHSTTSARRVLVYSAKTHGALHMSCIYNIHVARVKCNMYIALYTWLPTSLLHGSVKWPDWRGGRISYINFLYFSMTEISLYYLTVTLIAKWPQYIIEVIIKQLRLYYRLKAFRV